MSTHIENRGHHWFIEAKIWKNSAPNFGKISRQTLEKDIIQLFDIDSA